MRLSGLVPRRTARFHDRRKFMRVSPHFLVRIQGTQPPADTNYVPLSSCLRGDERIMCVFSCKRRVEAVTPAQAHSLLISCSCASPVIVFFLLFCCWAECARRLHASDAQEVPIGAPDGRHVRQHVLGQVSQRRRNQAATAAGRCLASR